VTLSSIPSPKPHRFPSTLSHPPGPSSSKSALRRQSYKRARRISPRRKRNSTNSAVSAVRRGLEARCKAMVECGWNWGEMGKEGLRALEGSKALPRTASMVSLSSSISQLLSDAVGVGPFDACMPFLHIGMCCSLSARPDALGMSKHSCIAHAPLHVHVPHFHSFYLVLSQRWFPDPQHALTVSPRKLPSDPDRPPGSDLSSIGPSQSASQIYSTLPLPIPTDQPTSCVIRRLVTYLTH